MAKIKLQPTKMSDMEYIEYIKAKYKTEADYVMKQDGE